MTSFEIVYIEQQLGFDAGLRLFHGIRANTIAMPQVSVIPANISPAPTKAERAIQPGLMK
jgi:hypothetical protein